MKKLRVVLSSTRSLYTRNLSPYFHKYPSYVKQRWRGRTILEVFCSDFDSHNESYFKQAIESGLITVNGEKVACAYLLRDGDYIVHLLHRHEPAVSGDPIEVLSPTLSTKNHPSFLAILKPGGIPVHPCGPHQYLSLLALLARDSYNIRDLHPVHRLDRLTSGIVLMATGKEAASKMSAQFRGEFGGVRKRYVAIVEGEFPLAPGAADGKSCGCVFDTSFDATSVVELKRTTTPPTTIAYVNSSSEGTKEEQSKFIKFPMLTSTGLTPLNPPTCAWIQSFKPHEIVAYADEGSSVKKKESTGIAAEIPFIGKSDDTGESTAQKNAESSHPPEMRERHFQQTSIPLLLDAQTRLPEISWVKRSIDGPAYLRVAVAIRTTDQKNALQNVSSTSSVLPSGTKGDVVASTGYKGDPFSSVGSDKESVTLFRRLACVKKRAADITGADNREESLSLIEVIPLSGRTHQIRLHAAWLGFPLEEDVVYNRKSYTKLLIDDSKDSVSEVDVKETTENCTHVLRTAEEEAAIKLCVFCTKGPAAEFTAVQRKADGICLHSCEYEGGSDGSDDAWHVKAPLPFWVERVLRYC